MSLPEALEAVQAENVSLREEKDHLARDKAAAADAMNMVPKRTAKVSIYEGMGFEDENDEDMAKYKAYLVGHLHCSLSPGDQQTDLCSSF